MTWKPELTPEKYIRVWIPAAAVPTFLGFYNFVIVPLPSIQGLIILLLTVFWLGMRLAQFLTCLSGVYFTTEAYRGMRIIFMALSIASVVASALTTSFHELKLMSIPISLGWNAALCFAEYWLADDDFFRNMVDKRILDCLGFVVSSDLASRQRNPSRRAVVWEKFKKLFRRRSTGPIALSENEQFEPVLELCPGSPRHSQRWFSWGPSPKFYDSITHWSRLSDRQIHKALWITADSNEARKLITQTVVNHLEKQGGNINPVITDVSQRVFWPVIRDFARASPEYRAQLAKDPPPILRFYYRRYPYSALRPPPRVAVWKYYEDSTDLIESLITDMINQIYRDLEDEAEKMQKKAKKVGKRSRDPGSSVDLEAGTTSNTPRVSRTVLVVDGLSNTRQIDAIYKVIYFLHGLKKNRGEALRIVIVSSSEFLRHVSTNDQVLLDYVCTLHAADGAGDDGILYSGTNPRPPELCENIFSLLVEGVHRLAGVPAARLWSKVVQFSPGHTLLSRKHEEPTTRSIFARLHNASVLRKRILESLKKDTFLVSRSQIINRVGKDNILVAKILQQVFELGHEKDIANIPFEHATAVLNLTHTILDGGLPPDKDSVADQKLFNRAAQRLITTLSKHLKILPQELAITGVVLSSIHPRNHGGFSNIYQGSYKNAKGENVQIALKVLRIFVDQSEEKRQALEDKFVREALVWRYLKNRNIVPFLGVDFATFPPLGRAMVSPWMAQGSLLKYIEEHLPDLPVARYAIELIADVSRGLRYLHKNNIVHGDLCGRNILIDDFGRACLTDFGLAVFIESDTSIKSSTRSGSDRWMAPELLTVPPGGTFRRTPASDIWAFGCVCGEIWSEGTRPFTMILYDAGITVAFSDPTVSAQKHPYTRQPLNKEGKTLPEIPEMLWELMQWCWKLVPAERPGSQALADILEEMESHHRSVRQREVPTFESEDEESFTSHPDLAIESRSPSPEPSDNGPSADSMPPKSIPSSSKGKQRAVRFKQESTANVVRFGPLDLGPESHFDDLFSVIFENLCEIVRRRALAKPRDISRYGTEHLDLLFKTEMEANNFAMTWTVHRFEPYSTCEAIVVEDD